MKASSSSLTSFLPHCIAGAPLPSPSACPYISSSLPKWFHCTHILNKYEHTFHAHCTYIVHTLHILSRQIHCTYIAHTLSLHLLLFLNGSAAQTLIVRKQGRASKAHPYFLSIASDIHLPRHTSCFVIKFVFINFTYTWRPWCYRDNSGL